MLETPTCDPAMTQNDETSLSRILSQCRWADEGDTTLSVCLAHGRVATCSLYVYYIDMYTPICIKVSKTLSECVFTYLSLHICMHICMCLLDPEQAQESSKQGRMPYMLELPRGLQRGELHPVSRREDAKDASHLDFQGSYNQVIAVLRTQV